MLFEVDHTTSFVYSGPVFVEPITVRLHPRPDPSLRLLRFELRVEPEPAGSTELTDVEGNAVSRVWFEGLTKVVTLRTSFAVQTLRANPFDFIVLDPGAMSVPMSYVEPEREALERYLTPFDEAAASFARGVEWDGGGVEFLGALASRISHGFEHTVRSEGEPWPPGVTLHEGKGSCRDLAVLFIDACRSVGIGARFVSGYQEGDPEAESHLHAWAEAYLPGAGWRGFDPTQGLAVADRHVPVAAAPTAGEAAPTEGSFRGSGVRSSLETRIAIRVS